MSAGTFAPEAPRDCPLCPRLVEFREEWRAKEPDWFNAPVPSFGAEDCRLLVLGLAPGLRGANRTGRPFTGDWAGDLLYPTLQKYGFAKGEYDARPDDGLTLSDCMITNAVRCVPPQNKPTGPEAKTCRNYLVARLEALPRLQIIVALGKIAHDNALATLGYKLSAKKFAHAAEHELEGPNGPLLMIDSYHCSRYNTNTGRLTEAMFHDVFEKAKKRMESA